MKQPSPRTLAVLAGLAAAGAAALAVDAFLVEPAWTEITHHDLPVPDLPADWSGARVVHLTDLHYRDGRSEALFERTVETVNRMQPDLIVCTGDFVHGSERQVDPCARHLQRLRSARGKVGVLGDHDYNFPKKRVFRGLTAGLEGAGFLLLRNRHVELDGGLLLAGIDPTTHKIRFGRMARALEGLGGRLPHLFLAHSPDIVFQAAARRVPIVLCGHTHGGQVVIPFYGPPVTRTRVGRRFASGWAQVDGTRIYTCRGVTSHFSLRFCCRPEIACFTLRPA